MFDRIRKYHYWRMYLKFGREHIYYKRLSESKEIEYREKIMNGLMDMKVNFHVGIQRL